MPGLSSILNQHSFIKQIPIFRKLNWFEVRKVAAKAAIVEYKKGDIVYREGDPPDAFYCLISGRLQAYTKDKEGNKCNVEYIMRGLHFGIISTLTGENHSLSFEAVNDSVVIKIEREPFLDILKSIPHLGAELSQSLSRRIRHKALHAKSIFESTITSVYCPVKGSGSSTYAANLAFSLKRETQKKVILVHLSSTLQEEKDRQSQKENSRDDVHFSVKTEAAARWADNAVFLSEIVDDYEGIMKSVITQETDIDLLNVRFNSQDESLVNWISQFVTSLVDDYHYVVVDLPNEMDDVVLKTLTQSDVVQLLALERQQDLVVMRQIIQKIKEELKENFKKEKLHVILRTDKERNSQSFESINNILGYNIYTKLPHVDDQQLEQKVTSQVMSITLPSWESDYAKVIRKMAREIGNVLVGLVLGGGAALGIAHIGVFRKLEEENIPVDIVVGSSMGALIGSFWVTGMTIEKIEKLAREFEHRWNLFKLMDLIIPISGFIGGRAIKRWLKRNLGNKIFYNTQVPFKVVAYDLAKREEMVIDSGLLVEAIRKSISIPGVMKPVIQGDEVIIDGGVLNPLPTNVLTRLGTKKIIAVNVLQSPDDMAQGFMNQKKSNEEKLKVPFFKAPVFYIMFRVKLFFAKVFMPSISDIIVNSLMASEYVISEQSEQNADVVIRPDLVGINWFELYKVDDLVRRGYEAAEKVMPQIKQLISE